MTESDSWRLAGVAISFGLKWCEVNRLPAVFDGADRYDGLSGVSLIGDVGDSGYRTVRHLRLRQAKQRTFDNQSS